MNQSEIPSYPPLIANLFAPKQPIKYIEPIDYPIESRKLPNITPIGSYLDKVKSYNKEVKYESTEGLQQKEQRLKKEKNQKQQEKLTNDLNNWDPLNDPHIQNSDPYKTLFVGRLNYEVTELDLQQFFSKYGSIKKLRLVRNKQTSQSKGYAFLEFEHEKDSRSCFKEANGAKIMDRTILIDFERSRLIKNWKPRRLGGGLGGRNYTKIEKEKETFRERRDAAGGSYRNNNQRGGRYNSRPHERAPYERREPRYSSRGGRDSYRGGGGGYRGRY